MKKTSFILFLFFLSSSLSAEEPWFAGSILANSAVNLEKNHYDAYFYQFYLVNDGEYLRHSMVTSTPAKISNSSLFELTAGLTNFWDLGLYLNLNRNIEDSRKKTNFGDTNLQTGFQILRQNQQRYQPNIRLSIQETFPTGRFDNLSPIANGTDSSGLGSYQTNFGLNFSYVCEPILGHYLNTTLNLNYLFAQPTRIKARNTYGGTHQTDGVVDPGNLKSIDLAFQLTFTQHIVLVMETYLSKRSAEKFSGFVGVHTDGEQGAIGDGFANTEYTLAPAIQLFANKHLAVIAGYWYTIGGNNNPRFYAPVISVGYQS